MQHYNASSFRILGSTIVTAFYLAWLFENFISKYSHILGSWGLEVQHVNFGGHEWTYTVLFKNELTHASVPPSLKSHWGDVMAKGEVTLAVFVSQLANPSLLSLIRQQQSQPHSGVLCCVLLRCSVFGNPGANSLTRTGQDTPTKGRNPMGHRKTYGA